MTFGTVFKLIPIWGCIFFISISPLKSQESSLNVYVWEFTTKDGKVTDLTQAVTDQFEEALVQSGCCNVLQRRLYARLLEHKNNEKRIKGLSELTESSRNNFQSLEANSVIFGEIFDDISSGQVKISVNVESFNNKIQKIASVYLPKYQIMDHEKREDAMKNLTFELEFQPRKEIPIDSIITDDWKFELMRNHKTGNTVTSHLRITSRYKDRNIRILGSKSEAIDNFNYLTEGTAAKIANQQSKNPVRLLVADIPVDASVVFPNVPNRATAFSLLKIYVNADDHSERYLQFRKVGIK